MRDEQGRIEVTALPNPHEKFAEYIRDRGGVQVWRNINLSNRDAGDMYTPALTETGEPTPKPHWSVAPGEVITDITRFRFCVEQREVKRLRIALRMGSQGLMIKLTDNSSAKLRKWLGVIEEKYGKSPCYHWDGWDGKDAVITIPIFEDESVAPGALVQKIHVRDGSTQAGKAEGPVLTVTDVTNHKPVDGPGQAHCVCHLSDGSWEFIWNLKTVKGV